MLQVALAKVDSLKECFAAAPSVLGVTGKLLEVFIGIVVARGYFFH